MCKRVKPQHIALLKLETMWTVEVKYKHFYVMAKVDVSHHITLHIGQASSLSVFKINLKPIFIPWL